MHINVLIKVMKEAERREGIASTDTTKDDKREIIIIPYTRKRISTGNERRNIMGVPYTRSTIAMSPYGVRE